MLYSWIESEHLEIKLDTCLLNNSLINFSKLPFYRTPTEKINCYMKHIKFCYKEIGIEKGAEEILPILIYSIIKSDIHNVYIEKLFMNYYKHKNFNRCQHNCTHLNNNFLNFVEPKEICDCLDECMNNYNETTYYLALLDTAISFIERIEFKSLNISREEYNAFIDQKIISLKEPNKIIEISSKEDNKISRIIKYFRKQK
ncbi:vacuolar sorting protein 9 domain-containing protein [Hamiltosporidium magnivora]|uniref:Vacuolar sorting protein 9 domain-containing protein n=1 Tax=Hamiltosporidium magnivora TaxID=148818 RepID=A0A4Q9LJ70_9MICR|nr:hypothetical protein LUQ84_000943 [Hamiltosporidium tvaerminnensis]TBU08248.1 vacuolar sorting protein 9 domain-containing protein [Hamiltosporidium magnivora]